MLKTPLRCSILSHIKQIRGMSTQPGSNGGTSHAERTAAEPRDDSLHRVILGDINQVNDRIRTLRLNIPKDGSPIKFLPGQWLDVHVPGVSKPGGFTITSAPSAAQIATQQQAPRSADGRGMPAGHLELAVQRSPDNPPAAWLWRPAPEILGRELQVRVGGSFVWPPPNCDLDEVKRVVLVAGGVGINPFMSMIAHMGQSYGKSYTVSLLYSVRGLRGQELSSVLYLQSLARLYAAGRVKGEMVLHLTTGGTEPQCRDDEVVELEGWKLKCRRRRISKNDLLDALGSRDERSSAVAYICGVPAMTDELVEIARQAPGMNPNAVLCERWW